MLFFELSFAFTYPNIFITILFVLRFVTYMFSFIIKEISHYKGWTPPTKIIQLLSLLYNYPEDYFKKLFNVAPVGRLNYPATLPSGMPWNLSSIIILKLMGWIYKEQSDQSISGDGDRDNVGIYGCTVLN